MTPSNSTSDRNNNAFNPDVYNQNYQQFRSLNQIMWQIPVLAMTLTGGLWFGVSKIEDNPLLITILLSTAFVGNILLSIVLLRFRHVMACYLKWLENVKPNDYVDVNQKLNNPGWLPDWLSNLCRKDQTVRFLFQLMLWWAALSSIVLLVGFWIDYNNVSSMKTDRNSVSFYDQHAEKLADNYESITFEMAYPFLIEKFKGAPKTVLDIGSGTGRDAGWITKNGHHVVAVDPSSSMRRIASKLHPNTNITWVEDKLPYLSNTKISSNKYDVILANAVWMHVAPNERQKSLKRIYELLKANGSVYVSLRLGPQIEERGMHKIFPSEFVGQAKQVGFTIIPTGDFPDLLGRPEVSWKMYELKK